jgi:quinol monooxygenase YgiN
MSTEVSWSLELNIQPGREADFQALAEEMAAATEANEPGTLSYEWSTDEDGTVCHIYERYADSEAVMAHLASFGENYMERFLDILQPARFVVYGSPSQEVKDGLAPFNPVYMQSVGGFTR